MPLIHVLKPNNHPLRDRFRMSKLKDINLCSKIIFSEDSPYIVVNNEQNGRNGYSENPQILLEPKYNPKECLFGGGIVSPFLLQNEVGHGVIVKRVRYRYIRIFLALKALV